MTVAINHLSKTASAVGAPPRLQAIVVSHTHWDREWYLTQQQFQFMLGDTLDAVIDTLDNERGFRCFMADGQTSMIHDYLEIRPGRRADINRLIRANRIAVGPWYTMPDLWLPSGEAIIRNLLRGRIDCERLGTTLPMVGYVPDSFGHIEQMPQLLNGFGIHSYFFARGKAEGSSGELAFAWIGPDGMSQLTAHRLPSGYANATMLPPADSTHLKARLDTILRPYIDNEHSAALLLNGIDHIWIQRDLPRLLKEAATLFPEVDFSIGTLHDFLSAYGQQADSLPRRQGCLRDTWLSPNHLHGTWSSRVDNKLANARAQTALEGLAEPAAVMLMLAGGPNRRPDLALAWESVLQNHAHDSICGCSMDAVHADVNTRFREAEELAEMITADAIHSLAGEVKIPAVYRLAGIAGAFRCCELIVDRSDASPFAICDEVGNPLAIQPLGQRKLRRHDCLVTEDGGHDPDRGIIQFYEHRLLVQCPEIAPLELQRLGIRPTDAVDRLPDDCVKVSACSIENRFIRVEANNDGTIRLCHKETGQVFDRLLELYDEGDAGGGYVFKPLEEDPPMRSREASAEIRPIESGPLRGTLRIALQWRLPEGMDAAQERRSTEDVGFSAEFDISLSSDEAHVACRLRLVNHSIGHRVRLNLPMPFETSRANAERAFVVADEEMSRFSAEAGQNTHPMRNWVALAADAAGLAFVGNGLHEYALEKGDRGTDLRVTLLRSVRFVDICGTWRTPDAELCRTLEYEFSLMPFAGDWRKDHIAARAQRLIHRSAVEVLGDRRTEWDFLPHATIRMEEYRDNQWIPVSSHRSSWRRHFGERDGWRRRECMPRVRPLPALLKWNCDGVLLSCIKPAERNPSGAADVSQDIIVRFYSLAEAEQIFDLYLALQVMQVWRCDLAESPLHSLELEDNGVQINISPFEIVTLRLRFGKIN